MQSLLSITAKFIADAVGGQCFLPEQTEIHGVCIDSRKVQKGDLFVALAGERADGHTYAAQAVAKGAACILACKPLPSDLPHIMTDDTVAALGRLAHAYRMTLSPLTVGVTGSVGKTTTKQLISAVLSASFRTHHTEGNFNNELGLPLTLLSLRPEHEAAVLEMGMSARGEIDYLSRLSEPNIGVVTCIGTSHIEALGSREGIRDAKMEILNGLKENGEIILSGDEPLLSGYERAIYVGFAPQGKRFWKITDMRVRDGGTAFDLLSHEGEQVSDLFVPGVGAHLVADAAMACVVGRLAKMTWEDIAQGLLTFENTGMRQRIESFDDVTLIIDCYNAAPESMKASLNVLANTAGTRRIAVLGDILELGSFSDSLHESVGKYVALGKADLLFTFGHASLHIAKGALVGGMPESAIRSFPDITQPELLAKELKSIIQPHDTLLFKASRGIALERVIQAFKEI